MVTSPKTWIRCARRFGGADNVVDSLWGGVCNDTYRLGAGSDEVVDRKSPDDVSSLNGGLDTITSTISRSLGASIGVKNFEIAWQRQYQRYRQPMSTTSLPARPETTSWTPGIDTVTDTLQGGAGNDIYILGSGTGKVIDTGGDYDAITSTASRNLTDYATIEDLVLKKSSNVNGTGNALANIISGNSGNNILNGGTDNMVDALKGDLGNDTYVLLASSSVRNDLC